MSTLLENIHGIINQSMKAHNIPGAAVAVIKDNEVLFSQGFGQTTVEEWGAPIRSNTLFRIASVSKLFTGTMLMMLVEKGLIDLDKPVQYYVPWFTTSDPELSKLITIRMLLSHSSGLPTGGDVSFHYSDSGLYDYMKQTVPTLPLLFHPGTAYSYGNHALNIAGFVAEQVTKKKFENLMEEMLFTPLEMRQTTYNPLRAMAQPLALPHDRDSSGNLTVSEQFFDNVACYPSYYAFSSIEDLSKFALLHLREGVYKNKQILTSTSIAEMRKQQSKWYTPNDGGCGINFFQEVKDGIQRFWHYGQYSYQYSSQFILVPEKGIAVIALANGENIFQAGYEIVDELLKNEKVAAPKPANISTEPDWQFFKGTYLHSYFGLIELTGNRLIKIKGTEFELIPYSIDTYLAKDEQGTTLYTIGFTASSVKCIVVNTKGCSEFNEVYTPNPNDWFNWEGQYSDGRDSYEVSIQGESLLIKEPNQELLARPISRNKFLSKETGLVRFIEVNGVITIEFDYAWRYPKQNWEK
jgi:CubicO group peptidase (beta-lactamase class C family)